MNKKEKMLFVWNYIASDLNFYEFDEDESEALLWYRLGHLQTKENNLHKNVIMGWYIYNVITGGDFTF